VELILWRHAEAEDGFPDAERALSKKGQQDAKKMALWLSKRIPADTVILVSPAKRAQQTAAYLTVPFLTCEKIAPGASGTDVLLASEWGSSKKTVLVIGHQPSLGMAASLAIMNKPYYWCVKKGAIWWLSKRMRSEDQETIIKAVMAPELL